MTIRKSIFIALITMLGLSGCAITESQQVAADGSNSDMQKIENFVEKNKKNTTGDLLKTSPAYAQKNQQKAVEANIADVKNTMPLYRQPLFGQMVVFPYISDSGIYHGYQESWIKVKEGEFVLAAPNSSTRSEMVYDLQEVK